MQAWLLWWVIVGLVIYLLGILVIKHTCPWEMFDILDFKFLCICIRINYYGEIEFDLCSTWFIKCIFIKFIKCIWWLEYLDYVLLFILLILVKFITLCEVVANFEKTTMRVQEGKFFICIYICHHSYIWYNWTNQSGI